jgi:hypothetical protein
MKNPKIVLFTILNVLLSLALYATAQVDNQEGSKSYTANGPVVNATAITEDDDVVLDNISRGIYVGTGGDMTVLMRDGEDPVEFTNIPDGTVLPIRIQSLMEASTVSDVVNLHD